MRKDKPYMAVVGIFSGLLFISNKHTEKKEYTFKHIYVQIFSLLFGKLHNYLKSTS